MSSVARSYNTLSGCALVSALAALSAGFFVLCRICALAGMPPSRPTTIAPDSNLRMKPFEVADFGVCSKQHLSEFLETRDAADPLGKSASRHCPRTDEL